MKLIRRIYLLNGILIVFLQLIFILEANAQTQSFELLLTEESVIGNEEVYSPNTSFAQPGQISVNSRGEIYVVDAATMDIRVFNKDGTYIKTIGKRGRGPGEFLSVNHIFHNERDELLVFDEMQFRVLRYDAEDELIETIMTPRDSQPVNFFIQVQEYRNDHYLALYKIWGSGRYAQYDSDALFHIWDPDFQNEVYTFGSFEQLGYSEPFAERTIRRNVGSYVQVSEEKFLFAPHLYEGKLFEYDVKNPQGYSHIVHGHDPGIKSSQTLQDNSSPFSGRKISAGEAVVYGKINVVSGGLFRLQNGNFIHFSFIFDEDSSAAETRIWKFGAELFDEDYNFLGYQSLGRLTNINPYFRYFKVMDSEEKLYAITEEDGIPVVKIYSIQGG